MNSGMLSVLTFADRRTKLGALVLDCLISEEIDLPSKVTRYPVEDGSVISDHIALEPETVRIAGRVSTADVLAFGFVLGNSGGATKLVEAVDALRAMHAERAIIEISTGQMVYTDMAFTSLNAVRSADGDGGNWLDVRAELTKVRKVTLKSADVPAETAQEPAKGRAGKTATPAGRNATTTVAPPAAGASPGAGQSQANRFGDFIRNLRNPSAGAGPG